MKTNECTTIIIKFGDFGKTSIEQTCSSDIETPCDDDSIDPVGKIDNFSNHILNMQKALIGTIENEDDEETPIEITTPFTSDGNIKPEEVQEEEIEEDELEDDKTGQQFDKEGEEELIVQDNHNIICKFDAFLERLNPPKIDKRKIKKVTNLDRIMDEKPDKEKIRKGENLKRSVKLAPNIPVVNPPSMK